MRLDPRRHAIRADLADIELAGQVFAPRYAAATARTALVQAAIRPLPRADAEPLSEILAGETFELIDTTGDWAWGRCRADGSVGYVRGEALGAFAPAPELLPARSLAAAATGLIDTPRLPGGRSSEGVDEGGFVFLAAARAGHAAPRFLDVQRAELEALPAATAPGDLLFGDTGVAILLDDGNAVVVTPALARVERRPIAALRDHLGAAVARRLA